MSRGPFVSQNVHRVHLTAQSNGRCERSIRTLKDLLELRDWENDEEFVRALAGAVGEHNHTPHQGIGYLTPAAHHTQGVICQA